LDLKFQEVFESLIKNNSLKEEMQIQLKELAKPDAAIVIVNEMMALL
jgi:hypothetical protein